MKSNREKREEIKRILSIDSGFTLNEIAIRLDQPLSVFKTKNRKREILVHRQISMAYFYGEKMALKNIGIVHGGFDHSSVLNAIRSIKNDIETRNKETLEVLTRLRYGFK